MPTELPELITKVEYRASSAEHAIRALCEVNATLRLLIDYERSLKEEAERSPFDPIEMQETRDQISSVSKHAVGLVDHVATVAAAPDAVVNFH